MHFEDEVWGKVVFCKADIDINTMEGKIIFLLSSEEIDYSKILYFEDVPVLFPISNLHDDTIYSFINNNLVFHHDLIKSAFYLLSCYQEFNSKEKDTLGRYEFDTSVQKRLGITGKPVVNYYFNFIAKGVSEYCLINNISLPKIRSTDHHYLFLSHDIDRIRYYTIPNLFYKLKEILRLVQTSFTFSQNIILLINLLTKLLYVNKDRDPYWNFEFLLNLEKKFRFRSTWFFLHKDMPHKDGYYTFDDPRIKNLIGTITSLDNETAFHNSLGSVENFQKIKSFLGNLQENCTHPIYGVRQHWLKLNVPSTLVLFNNAGFRYDSSLGYAKHEGFRSSYCFPHKIFDHQNDVMLNLWEIPLIAMDSTLFDYRKYSYIEAINSIKSLKEEVKRFGGIFSLLWHNSYFDEVKFLGITSFYSDILSELHSDNFESLTGNELIDIFEPNI
jgi:hypothetical protein